MIIPPRSKIPYRFENRSRATWKLGTDDVAIIRLLTGANVIDYKEIASMFGVSRKTVERIASGQYHIDVIPEELHLDIFVY